MRAVRQTTIIFICAAIISPGGVAALFARRCWVLGSFVPSGRAGPGDPRRPRVCPTNCAAFPVGDVAHCYGEIRSLRRAAASGR